MGTRALLTIYNRNIGKYLIYFIKGDGLYVLQYFRVLLQVCKSIKSITKSLDKYMKKNPGTINFNVQDEPYPEKKYWPFIEYSMRVEIEDNSNEFHFNNFWKISPIYETMEKSLELAKGQKEGFIHKQIYFSLE